MRLTMAASIHPHRGANIPSFFLLVFALSVPFWLVGTAFGQLLPGVPASALAVVCPTIAASILTYRKNNGEGLKRLLKRSFDYDRIKIRLWYAPAVLLMPAVMALSYAVMRALGTPVPSPRFAAIPALALFLVFFLSSAAEELGWSGYAIDPMQSRWGALQAAVLLGLVWAVWHFVPLAQAHRTPAWIAWWSLGTVAQRVIVVWLYNNAGKSVFAATLFHAMSDVSWQLFPVHGSFYDPRITGTITAIAAAIVTGVSGPRTLTRGRRGLGN